MLRIVPLDPVINITKHMIDPRFVFLGALINICGSIGYVIATVQGKTQPNRVTWFIWAIAPLVIFAAQLGQGVGLSSVMTLMVGLGPLLIFVASFVNRNAYWKISKLDWICGSMSVVALILWAITRTGNVAIALSILADALAAAPTLRKAYLEPESEKAGVFALAALSAVITLLTLEKWTFADYGFPAYIFVICVSIVLVVVCSTDQIQKEQRFQHDLTGRL